MFCFIFLNPWINKAKGTYFKGTYIQQNKAGFPEELIIKEQSKGIKTRDTLLQEKDMAQVNT